MASETIKKNIDYFQAELPRLLQDVAYKGKFVIIHDAKINGVFDSFEAALTDAVAKFRPNDFIIQEVIDEKERANFIRSAVT